MSIVRPARRHGLVIVFLVGAGLSVLAAFVSGLRGNRPSPHRPTNGPAATCRSQRRENHPNQRFVPTTQSA
ncbi:MAG: hypothetical protein ABI355_04805 [Solirubrobacteraceae bacterium]